MILIKDIYQKFRIDLVIIILRIYHHNTILVLRFIYTVAVGSQVPLKMIDKMKSPLGQILNV